MIFARFHLTVHSTISLPYILECKVRVIDPDGRHIAQINSQSQTTPWHTNAIDSIEARQTQKKSPTPKTPYHEIAHSCNIQMRRLCFRSFSILSTFNSFHLPSFSIVSNTACVPLCVVYSWIGCGGITIYIATTAYRSSRATLSISHSFKFIGK